MNEYDGPPSFCNPFGKGGERARHPLDILLSTIFCCFLNELMMVILFLTFVVVGIFSISRNKHLLWKERSKGERKVSNAASCTLYSEGRPTTLLLYGGHNETTFYQKTYEYVMNIDESDTVSDWAWREKKGVGNFGGVANSAFSNWVQTEGWKEDDGLKKYSITNSIGCIVAFGKTGFGATDYFDGVYIFRKFWEKLNLNAVPEAPRMRPTLSQVDENTFILFGSGPSNVARTCILSINDTTLLDPKGDLECITKTFQPEPRYGHMAWSLNRYFYIYGGQHPVSKKGYHDMWSGRLYSGKQNFDWVSKRGERYPGDQLPEIHHKSGGPEVTALPYIYGGCGGSYVSALWEKDKNGVVQLVYYGGDLTNGEIFSGVFSLELTIHQVESSQLDDMKSNLAKVWGVEDKEFMKTDETFGGTSATLKSDSGFQKEVKSQIPSGMAGCSCWVLPDRDDVSRLNLFVLGGQYKDSTYNTYFFSAQTVGVDFLLLSATIIVIVGTILIIFSCCCTIICFPVVLVSLVLGFGTVFVILILGFVSVFVIITFLSLVTIALFITVTCPLIPIFLCICCCCGLGICCCTLYRWNSLRRLKKKLKEVEGDDIDRIMREEEENNAEGNISLSIDHRMFQVDYEDIKVEKSIGKGGSDSIVFKAEWERNTIAFKVFQTRTVCSNQDDFDEFSREVNILSSTSHPNILKFFGATMKPPRVGILMEFCEEGDLNIFLKKNPDYDMDERIRILLEISSAMAYLHDRNIIHRDMKCENVLLTQEKGMMRPKVMDFGLSRTVDRMSVAKTKRIGTCFYMAPEVTKGEDYTEKCDVFSFSVIMWEVLTGSFTPYGDKQHNVENKVAHNPIFRPDVETVKKSIGEERFWIIPIMESCWSHDYHDRPSFKEIYEMLKKGIDGDNEKKEEVSEWKYKYETKQDEKTENKSENEDDEDEKDEKDEKEDKEDENNVLKPLSGKKGSDDHEDDSQSDEDNPKKEVLFKKKEDDDDDDDDGAVY